MSFNPPVLDTECGNLDLIERHLLELDGSRAKFIDYMPSHAAVVLWIDSAHVDVPSVYLDCMMCTAMVISPTWEPTRIRMAVSADPESGLVLTDKEVLRLECRSIRLVQTERTQLWFYSTPFFFSFFDLLYAYRSISKPAQPKSFRSLCFYLDGYNAALSDQGRSLQRGRASIFAFQNWLKAKFGYENWSYDWRHAITEKFPDDAIAYEQFFRLLDEFLCGVAIGTIREDNWKS